MPLTRGTSKKTIGKNIAEMEASGHSKAQSIAASLNEARESGAHIPKPKKESTMRHKEEHHRGEHKKEHHKKEMHHEGHKDGHMEHMKKHHSHMKSHMKHLEKMMGK